MGGVFISDYPHSDYPPPGNLKSISDYTRR